MKTKLAFLLPMLLALTLAPAGAAVRYVNLANPNPAPPYTTWTSAATNIQDAIDAAEAGNEIVVTNGVYATGGRAVVGTMTNRVAVTKAVTVRSVNGPEVTVIQGYHVPGTRNGDGAVRCAYVANGAALVGFTLTNGATRASGEFNREQQGGGAWCESASAVVSNCVLTGNSARSYGGGAYYGMLNNCALTGNSANYGGGAYYGTLNNCTVTANSADFGGGAFQSTLNNCIVYYNTAGNYSGGTLNYSCTTPLPASGVGNIIAEPELADAFHLSRFSPCREVGSAAYASGVDIDGEPWANRPSIGCDEFYGGPATGPLTVAIEASHTYVATRFVVDFQARSDGEVSVIRWDYGDGVVESNHLHVTHGWALPGDYSVVLHAYNDTHPEGVSATVTVRVLDQPVHYVAQDSSNPLRPYGSWATAATNIQDAVDAATPPSLVLVSNGVYNPVVVMQPIAIRSLNGPEVTSIDGGGAARCVYLGNSGAALSGFTLTHGVADYGAGVWCVDGNTTVSNCVMVGNNASSGGGGASGGTLNNCTLTGNSARNDGGGARGSTLNNCTLTGNSAGERGGGAFVGSLNSCDLSGNSAQSGGGACGIFFCPFGCLLIPATLNNCTLTGNSASYGGGADLGTLNNCTVIDNLANSSGGGVGGSALTNCIVYYNFAGLDGDNYDSSSELNSSCTTPLPLSGRGNFAERPLLMDLARGDFRLQSDSPCINAGLNAYETGGIDLDGNPRIAGGTVDVGAYEFQSPQSLLSYAWLQQYGLPTDGSADDLDLDGDLLSNFQEWRAGTDPNDALSALRLLPPLVSDTLLVTWKSVPGRTYSLERSETLGGFQSFIPVATGIPSGGNLTTYFDFGADLLAAARFYRVRVE